MKKKMNSALAILPANIQEDIKLAKEISQGNKIAFEIIYNKYNHLVYKRVSEKVRDKDKIKDLTSEIFAKVYLKSDKYSSDKGTYCDWIFTVVRNHVSDYFRHLPKDIDSLDVEPNEDGEIYYQIASSDHTPEERTVNKQMKHFVHNLVDSIVHSNMREVVKLRYFEELSYEEIMDKTGLPMSAVKTLLHQAKSTLKKRVPHGIK